MITLDRQTGSFLDDAGQPFIPVGANYWPASCGVEMWQAWPREEIIADLDAMAGLGFNAVRFFLRWADFEPERGAYDETMWERLDWLLAACIARGLHPHPSLLVGWMSGGVFWPSWKTGGLFTDATTIEATETFVREAAARMRPHAASLVGIDLGNELNALAECQGAPPAAVRAWCERIVTAVREELPGAIILSGCDHQQVTADTGWRLGDQPGIDVQTMHGYPVPTWHPVPCGGLRDGLTGSLLPFYIKCARAFGPVMLQEFGTILAAHPDHADHYLRTMLPACRRAGANGFLWWCFRDIRADVHPYVKNHFESELGLVDDDRRVKPALRYFVEFARSLVQSSPSEQKPGGSVAGLYWPKHYYNRDEAATPGNTPGETARRMIIAHRLLEKLGFRVAIIRGDRPLPADVGLILIPGLCTDRHEIAALAEWVRAGGHLWWHGPDPVNWGADMASLVGARIADYHFNVPASVNLAGATHRLGFFPRGLRLEAMPAGAQVIASDEIGNPLILSHSVGRGRSVSVLADVEAGILSGWPGEEAAWTSWYAALVELVASGKLPVVSGNQ